MSTPAADDRTALYETQPMLRLLDAWVLDVIDELDGDSAAALSAMTPTLVKALGVEASTWQEVVETAMHLEPGMRDDIVRLWQRNVDRFAEAGSSPDPRRFAHGVVDANLR